MNSEEIRQLLEKYYNGESTIDEEHQLKEFFNTADIPDEFITERDIFRYYSDSVKTHEPGNDFEERIISAIDNDIRGEDNTKLRSLFVRVSGIAAAIVILAGSYLFFFHNRGPADTYSDPQIAYAETMKILYDVSSRLNHGTRKLERINTMKQVTIKSLNTINNSSVTLQEVIKPLGDISEKTRKDKHVSNIY